MIPLSPLAVGHVRSLVNHYETKGRLDAVRNLGIVVEQASARIAKARGPFFNAPRPYPALTQTGWRWLKEKSYWIAFSDIEITAVFHESANIPARLP